MNLPAVGIIILNWNNAGDTIACLRSVQALDYPNATTLVVDNGSTDDSVQQIRAAFPSIAVLETGENLGYAEGNNVGVRAALAIGAEYVLVLNNDVTVATDALTLLVETMEANSGVGIAGPAVYYADPSDKLFAVGSSINWRRATIEHMTEGVWPEAARYPAFLVGCAICVRRAVMNTVGLLDPAYYLNWEDVEWCVRIGRKGWTVCVVPEAKVWHRVSASLGQASAQSTYYMTRNALLFFSRNAPGVWRVVATGQVMLRTLRTVAAWTLKPTYNTPSFRRKRAANLLAVRDFLRGRYGRMGGDVARACGLPVSHAQSVQSTRMGEQHVGSGSEP